MSVIDEHIKAAESTVKSDPAQSQAWSLLAILKMIKAVDDRSTELDHRQEQFDKQDEVLGKVSEGLMEMIRKFNINGWPHISNEIQELIDRSGL